MSGTAGGDPVEVERDGIRVVKGFEAEEFPVPAVTFSIASAREETVTVRVEDDIPESFSMDGVGFHPDYDGDNWTAYQDHRVAYERPISPGEEVVTVYGIRVESAKQARQFLSAPTVSVPDDGEPTADAGLEAEVERSIEDIAPQGSSKVVREFIAGEREAVPGASAATPAGGGADASITMDDAPAGAAEAPSGIDEPPDTSTATGSDDITLDDEDAERLLGDLEDPADASAGAESDDGTAEASSDDPATTVEDEIDFDLDEGVPDADADEGGDGIEFGEVAEPEETEPAEAAGGSASTDPEPDEEHVTLEESDGAASSVDIDFGSPEPVEGVEESADATADADEAEEVGAATDVTAGATDPEPAGEPVDASGVESTPDEATSLADGVEETTEPTTSTDRQSTGVSAGDGDDAVDEKKATTAAPDATDKGSAAAGRSADGSLVEALAAEIEAGTASQAAVAVIEEAIGGDDGESEAERGPRSLQARLEHLESRVDEFDAYSTALRSFIDEEGTADEILAEYEERVDGLARTVEELSEEVADGTETAEHADERVSDLEERLEAAESSIGSVDVDLESLTERVDEQGTAVEDLEDDVGDVESTVVEQADELGGLAQRVDGVDDDLAEHASRLDGFDERISSLAGDVSALDEDVSALEGTLEEFDRRIEGLGGDVSSLDEQLRQQVQSLADDLEAVRADVEDIAQWRSELGEMFK